MRTAVISDIHANREALYAVFRDIEAQGVDAVACCGDVVGHYADAEECVTLLREKGVCVVAGNHDRVAAGASDYLADFAPLAAKSAKWTRRRLSPPNLEYLRRLPSSRLAPGGFVLFHGALHPCRRAENVRLVTAELIRRSFDALREHPSGARIGCFGHLHVPLIYCESKGELIRTPAEGIVELDRESRYLLNPGSVGQSRDGDPRAAYLILDNEKGSVDFRRVRYDSTPCVDRARKQGLLHETRVERLWRRLRRKLAAARGYIALEGSLRSTACRWIARFGEGRGGLSCGKVVPPE